MQHSRRRSGARPQGELPDASFPAGSEGSAEPEQLSGPVERIVFHSPETGFCVLRIRPDGRHPPVTVVGRLATIQLGEEVEARGRWRDHAKHGRQLHAELLTSSPPRSLAGFERYLGGGIVRGIGPALARRLLDAFGDEVLEVIESDPKRLRTVPGIGRQRAARIVEAWSEQRAVRDVMLFLYAHGLTGQRALRIHKLWGSAAIGLIRQDPYRLAREVPGVGFRVADAIASSLGLSADAPQRARAGLLFVLEEAVVRHGHCGLPEDVLLRDAEKLLEMSGSRLEEQLRAEVHAGRLVRDTVGERPCVFSPELWQAQRRVALRLRELAAGRPPWPQIDSERALGWVSSRLGVELASAQRDAVRHALRERLCVISGGPGVGKTTLVCALLRILEAKRVKAMLCAPTGRAAKRLAEASGRPARTIHRLLEFEPASGRFRRGAEQPLDCELLVVDESSMLDIPLMDALLQALPPAAALVLVGDVDQLPSVGPGQILSDLIGSRACPVVRLREIFRQVANSRIIVNAHRINEGRMPERSGPEDRPDGDFYRIEATDPESAARTIVELVSQRIPARFGLDPVRDIQVLCPMNRGQVGVRELNLRLQRTLNPGRPEDGIERLGSCYRLGDKVMQVRNDYDKDVFNGDIGTVSELDVAAQRLSIRFGDRVVAYAPGELDEIVLAYASSIHKSQGSEYPAVVIPVMMQHYIMLRRNLIYTAVTRGTRLVVLVGQERALALAVQERPLESRWSKLADWLTTPPKP